MEISTEFDHAIGLLTSLNAEQILDIELTSLPNDGKPITFHLYDSIDKHAYPEWCPTAAIGEKRLLYLDPGFIVSVTDGYIARGVAEGNQAGLGKLSWLEDVKPLYEQYLSGGECSFGVIENYTKF